MVKKLLKYEFMALGRILIPMAIVCPAFALLSSLTLLIPSAWVGTTVLQSLMISIFAILVVVFIFAAYIVCIVRFSKSLFSKEGYFTLALPVTPMQLLWTKFLSAVITILASSLIALISVAIFGAIQGVNVVGDMWSLILYIFDSSDASLAVQLYGVGSSLVGGMCVLLFIYACIAAGQFVNKNRAGLSIGAFILVWEALSVIFSLKYLAGASIIESGSFTAYYVFSISMELAKSLLLGVGSVFFIRYILKNKINLLA